MTCILSGGLHDLGDYSRQILAKAVPILLAGADGTGSGGGDITRAQFPATLLCERHVSLPCSLRDFSFFIY